MQTQTVLWEGREASNTRSLSTPQRPENQPSSYGTGGMAPAPQVEDIEQDLMTLTVRNDALEAELNAVHGRADAAQEAAAAPVPFASNSAALVGEMEAHLGAT